MPSNQPTPELQVIARARRHGDALALRATDRHFTYAELLARSAAVALALLDRCAADRDDLREAHVAHLLPGGIEHVPTQWGIWRAGGVAVPLSLSATAPELDYALRDSGAVAVITTSALAERLRALCDAHDIVLLLLDDVAAAPAATDERRLPAVASSRAAMMLYTSGTTSQPKGVLTTHANLEAQIATLVDAWRWRADDCIPLFLPLHHVHGIVNVVACALWTGATIEVFARFDTDAVLPRVAARAYSVFMAVPTIYVRLIAALEALPPAAREATLAGFAAMRLMVSGSAALPANVHHRWRTLTGQPLLERYGMTEIGMALSNPYDGERRPGTVGVPLPGVDVRLVRDDGTEVRHEGEPGEIQVRGPGVFREYWRRAPATAAAFDGEWFRTGDLAAITDGYFRILGRLSIDIIKSGGHKLSALEIEAVLLDHPSIAECAVVGLPDDEWGEVVAAAVVLQPGHRLDLDALRGWCRDRLAAYRLPRRLAVVAALPRNAMGKVTKPVVPALFRSEPRALDAASDATNDAGAALP